MTMKSRFTCLKIALISGVSATLAWPAVAAAQDSAAQATTDTAGIEDIVVTAQRRRERLQDVPLAVTAIQAKQIEASGIRSTLDIGTIAPSLSIGNSVGFVIPFIRGIGTTSHGPGAENSVATYVDGVYLASASAAIFTLNNIAQIEVLKGPQGTLFGRNATGGVIQITTRDPEPGLRGAAEIGYANYDTISGQAYLSGGSAVIAADLSLSASRQGDGYGTNMFNGKDVNKNSRDVAVRSKWLLRPTDSTTIRFVADYNETKGSRATAFGIAPGTVATFQPQGNGGGDYDINYNLQPYDRLKAGGASLRIDQDLGEISLASITAYRKSTFTLGIDVDFSPLSIVEVPVLRDREKQFSQELQLQSGTDSKLKWVLGAYYYFSRGTYDPSRATLAAAASPFGLFTVLDTLSSQKAVSYAAFGQASYEVLPDTNLTLGARYTYEKRTFDGRSLATAGGVSLGDLFPPIHDSDAVKKPTFRISVDHRFSPDVLAYASFNTGFKSGGYNAGVPTTPPFEPETLKAYEVGLKTDVFDRKVRFNPAVFYYTYKKIQVEQPVAGQVYYYNGPSAEIYGLDADLSIKLSPQLAVSGGFMLLHTSYGDFPNAIINTQLPTGGANSTVGSATGNQLSYAPKRSGSLAADYSLPVGDDIFSANVTVSYNSGFYAQPDNILRQKAYALLNASVKWTFASGLSAMLWGRNLTDSRVAGSLQPSSIGSLRLLNPPRTYGVTAKMTF